MSAAGWLRPLRVRPSSSANPSPSRLLAHARSPASSTCRSITSAYTSAFSITAAHRPSIASLCSKVAEVEQVIVAACDRPSGLMCRCGRPRARLSRSRTRRRRRWRVANRRRRVARALARRGGGRGFVTSRMRRGGGRSGVDAGMTAFVLAASRPSVSAASPVGPIGQRWTACALVARSRCFPTHGSRPAWVLGRASTDCIWLLGGATRTVRQAMASGGRRDSPQ